MEFYIEKHSSTPVVNQIEEQIKFAVMMGIFRNGDTLPSIRDIEKQTGIHHSQIHKAYLALRRSGLLVLTRGKGSVISTSAESPRSISDNCFKLSTQITSRARQMGLSPTAFARYMSRHAQESERKSPFISYVDIHEEMATQAAMEISQLWQVPVKGLTFQELKAAISKGTLTPKILVNHVLYEYARSLVSRKKSTVISIEARVSERTIKLLAEIKPDSSVLLIHQPQPEHRLHYMIEQMRELVKTPGVKILSTSIRKIPNFSRLLSSTKYDYYLIGPGVRGEVPHEQRQNPRVLQIDPQLDPQSLESARIHAGVVI
jgi:DNA-binding transcriptional regulator YhcF (GntR family)